VVISVSSVWKGLHPLHERVPTNTTDPANFLDSSPASTLVIVNDMWWRALGVAAVLLCVGVAGGYAVADRDQAEPQGSSTLAPVPAVSPSVPTPTAPTYAPDPDIPPLTTADLATETIPLRLDPGGPGVRVAVPVGWLQNRPEGKDFWTFAEPSNFHNTYSMRVSILSGGTSSKKAAMAARIAQLEDAEANGDLQDFQVTVQTDDTFEATYVADDHLRFTTERFVSFGGSEASASVAVTGRQVDESGMGDLLAQTVTSLRDLPAKQAETPDAA
jgi:hypothetical protein